MKRVFTIIFLCFVCVGDVFANDNLPQVYTPNNINPYKSNKWFDFLSFGEKSKEFQSDIDPDYDKYDYMLSRIEKEWFKQDYTNLPMADRLNRLEEHVFGTSFNEDVSKRCDRLKRAFNAQKNNYRKTQGLFSGVPTSIPLGVDELVGK